MKNGWGVKRDRMESLFRLGEGKREDEAKLTFLVEKGMNVQENKPIDIK